MPSEAAHYRHDRAPERILVCITEDWFAASHFRPILRGLADHYAQVTLATRIARHGPALEQTGIRLVPFDFGRGSTGTWRDVAVALRLLVLLWRLRPDVVHAIAMKPVTLASLLFRFSPARRLVLHVTGAGYGGTGTSGRARGGLRLARHAIRAALGSRRTWLLVENEDDGPRLGARVASGRLSVLGGAGIDPNAFPPQPHAPSATLRIAYVGRLVWTKGVDVLVEAQQRILRAGRPVELHLYGAPDLENPRPVPTETLAAWSRLPGVHLHGHVEDVREAWREADIAAFPSRGGEGLPRALLEAAASRRAVVVTDVPGCRDLIRDGIEGLVVPPEQPEALAAALTRLNEDPRLRDRLAEAARTRVLDGYSERDVVDAVLAAYRRLLEP